MTKPRTNLRLFVGIYPLPEVAARLLQLLDTCELPEHRATRTEQLHMTAQFIGDTPSKLLDQTIESVERAAAGVRGFALQPTHLIRLPRRGNTRLIAVETDCPSSLRELHGRLVQRLAHRPREDKYDRFLPHITLCRFGAPRANIELPTETVDFPPFEVRSIQLMRSTLTSDGAQHHEVAAVDLAAASV